MSIDICSIVRTVITSQFTAPDERVTGGAPNTDTGVYVVRGRAPTYERAVELVTCVTRALAEKGLGYQGKPAIELVGGDDEHAAMAFPVDVDGIRGAL